MIELIATAESIQQAKLLFEAGIDAIYVGEDDFGLRLPASFSIEELTELSKLAHSYEKKLIVALNAIMHNERIEKIIPYLRKLQEINVDAITVGDPGVVRLIKLNEISLPFIYDAQTLVTSAKQINFWAKRGAVGAVLARELPYLELQELAKEVAVPAEVLVYGATCIHHSKRPLVTNYFNFVEEDNESDQSRGLFISEPKNTETHYSIYEDINGTHVFANNDVNLLRQLKNLYDIGLTTWKLDGILTRGDSFIAIAKIFAQAKECLENGTWNEEIMEHFNHELLSYHPKERGLDEGFYVKDPNEIQ